MKKLGFSLIFLGLFACKQEKKELSESILVVPVDVKNLNKNEKLSSFIEDIKHISLETKDSSLIIRSIDKVQIDGDKIFVLDTYLFRGVMVFDTSGKYLYHLQAGGGAEGEFEHISDFDIDRKSKHLIIHSTPNLMYYSYSGKFLQKERLSFIATNFCVNYPVKAFIGQEFDLIAIDSNHKKILELFRKDSLHPLSFIQPLQAMNENILYRHYLNDTIYAIKNNKLIPHVFIDFGDKKISKEEMKKIMKNKDRNFPSNKMGRIKYYFETKQYIYFAFLYNQVYHIVYYDKKNKKSILFKADDAENNDITYESTMPKIVGTFGDYFIAAVFIEDVYLKKLVNSPFQINLSKSFSKKSVDKPENPNLILIKMKPIE